MKKIISILILSLFVYNTIGFLAVHPFLTMYYKYLGMQEAKMPSKEEMIERIVFSKEDILFGKIDFRWIHSREFKYNGDMYDIIEKRETENQLIVYCINDTKEKKLEEEFEKKVNNNLANRKRKLDNNSLKILISEAVYLNNGISIDSNKLSYCLSYIQNYISAWAEIPSPPPKYYS